MADDIFGYAPPGDPSFLRFVDESILEVKAAAAKGDQARVDEALGKLQRRLATYTQKDLAAIYREGYRVGSDGQALTKQASASSLTIRKRIARNATSAVNDIRAWATEAEEIDNLIKNRRRAEKIRQDALRSLQAGGLSPSDARKARELAASAESAVEKLTKDIQSRNVSEEPEVLYRRRRKAKSGARGTVAARRPAREYFEMLDRTARRDIANDAYIKGSQRQGVEWFMVSDGPDCGWSTHRDSEKANGKVVRAEEIVLLAHPNCQRSFHALPDGPRSKKTNELLERVTGMDRQSIETIAKAAAVAGYAFRVGQAVYESPLTRRVVRNIVEDAEIALSENLKKILGDWSNFYERQEGLAAAAKGWEDNYLSRDQVRAETTESLGKKLEANFDGSLMKKVKLTRQEMAVLGLKQDTISLGDLASRYADYTDFVRHERDRVVPALRAVGAAGQDEAVIRELYGTRYSFHTATRFRRGGELLNNYKRAVAAVDKAMEGVDSVTGIDNAVLAQVDLIRAAARVIDPFPWLRATANVPGGSLRFSVGMTSDGRQDLAQTLYLKMRGQEYRSRFNRVYQQNHLGMVPKPDITIRPQDIYEALLPRVSFLGNNLLNATIYAEGGKIIPVVHILPEEAYLRQLSLRWRLKSGAVESFVNDYKDWTGDMRSYLEFKLRELPEEMIWTIEVFRNGPITANVRLLSDGVDSYGVKLRPRSQKIRAAYKAFVREPEDAIDAIKEVVIVPRAWGGYTLDAYQTDKLELLVGLATLREGAMAEVARVIGIEYHRLLAVLDVQTRKYGERVSYLIDKVRELQGAEIEYGITALRVEEIRRRGKAVLDAALGSVEPRIVKVYNFAEKRYEWVAEGFNPTRHRLVRKGEEISSWTSTRVDNWTPKVKHVFQIGEQKVETFLEGLDRIAARLPGNATMDDFVREVDRQRDAGLFRLNDNTNARDFSDDHFTFKKIYDRIINDEDIDVDSIEELIERRFPRLSFLLDKVSAEAFVSQAGVETFVDIARIVDFWDKRGVLKGRFLDEFPEIKFLGADEIGERAAGSYAYFENQVLLRREFFGTAEGRNMMTQALLDDWASGWHPRTGDTAHTFVHEMGHYVTLELLDTSQKMRLWNKMVDIPAVKALAPKAEDLYRYADDTIERVRSGLVSYYEEVNGRMVDYHIWHHEIKEFFESEWFTQVRSELIGPQVSYYAMQDWAEFMAETFTQMMYGPDDNDFTKAMYEFLKDEGIF